MNLALGQSIDDDCDTMSHIGGSFVYGLYILGIP